jgi:hypothetical protein
MLIRVGLSYAGAGKNRAAGRTAAVNHEEDSKGRRAADGTLHSAFCTLRIQGGGQVGAPLVHVAFESHGIMLFRDPSVGKQYI